METLPPDGLVGNRSIHIHQPGRLAPGPGRNIAHITGHLGKDAAITGMTLGGRAANGLAKALAGMHSAIPALFPRRFAEPGH